MAQGNPWTPTSLVGLWLLKFVINARNRGFHFSFNIAEAAEAQALAIGTDLGQRIRRLLPADATIVYAAVSKEDPKRDARYVPGVLGAGEFVAGDEDPASSVFDYSKTSLVFRLEAENGMWCIRKFCPLPDEKVEGGKLLETIDATVGRPAAIPALPADGEAWEVTFAKFFQAVVLQTHLVEVKRDDLGRYNFSRFQNCYPMRLGMKRGGRPQGLAAKTAVVEEGGPVARGLVGLFMFDEGSGTTLGDASGSENHGTFGAGAEAPTWTSAGLHFDGGDKVVLPAELLADIRTVVFYGSLENTTDTYNVILSSDQNAGGLTWILNGVTGNFRPEPGIWVGGVGEGVRPTGDTFQRPGGQGCAWVQDGVKDRVYINGLPTGDISAGAGGSETSATGRAGGLVIGKNPANGSLTPFLGTVSFLALHNVALTADEVAQQNQVAAAAAAARGLTPYVNPAVGRQLWVEGDSISTDIGGTVTDWPTTASGLYASSWTTTKNALIGQTMQTIAGSIRSRTIEKFAPSATANAIVIFAGTNDWFNNPAVLPATVFGYLNTAVGWAVDAGFKVIVVPMLSRFNGTSADAFKNAYNALIASASWGPNVFKVPVSALPHLVPDGSNTNTTYFSDRTHPTNTGMAEIAAAVKTQVDAAG